MQHQQGLVVADQMPETRRRIYEQEDKSRDNKKLHIFCNN